MATNTKILFGLYDLTAKNDSKLEIEDKKSFSNLYDLKNDTVTELKYATLEKNYFTLDGTKKLLSESSYNGIGLCTNSMSDENRNFEINPVLTINFTKYHSSNGITFYFSEDNYCNDLNIKFYRDNELLKDIDFQPDSNIYFCSEIVQRYNKLIIIFKKTNNPYRYVKLINIVYGQNKIFEPSEIMSANILEEIDLLSNEISINTLDFSIFSKDESFNMLNPKGLFKLLQTRQMFKAYEVDGENEIDMGTFYLDEWKNETEAISNMKAIDLIGIMDKTTFYGGIYFDKPILDILDEIFTSANIDLEQYLEISEELANIKLSGYIPICTHREALQQVIFPIGAVADCSRSEKIKIYKINNYSECKEIDYKRKRQDSETVELSEIVTGVQVTAHEYTYNNSASIEELYNSELEIGEYLITFSEPVYNISVTNGNLKEYTCNYAKIEVSSKSTVIINGYKYFHTTQVYESRIQGLVDSDKENILQVTNATLINKEIAQEISDRILTYYQNSYNLSVDFRIKTETLGDTAVVDTLYNQKLKGVINKLDIDLTGGFIGSTTINGALYQEEQDDE